MKTKKQHKINYDIFKHKEKKKFREIIYKKFTKYTLFPLAVVIGIVALFYIGLFRISEERLTETLMNNVVAEIEHITKKDSENVNEMFKNLSMITEYLGKETLRVIESSTITSFPNGKPILGMSDRGFFYKKNDNLGASLYYSSLTEIKDYEYEKALKTEALDPTLKLLVEHYPEIVATYINTYDSMNRYYPFMPEEYWTGDITMEEYNFYYEADEEHNPERTTIWTGVYLDPAGQGWLTSCIYPVYSDKNPNFPDEEKLECVVGVDITINSILEYALDIELPWNGSLFIVDKTGTIIALDDYTRNAFGLNEKYKFEGEVHPDTFKPDYMNIFKNEKLKEYFDEEKIIVNRYGIEEYSLKGKDYLMAHSVIDETDWNLFTLVEKDSILEPVYNVMERNRLFNILAFVIIFIFILIFVVYIFRGANRVAKSVVVPVERMSYITSEITTNGIYSSKLPETQILELDILSDNFNKMTEELEKIHRGLEERVTNAINEIRNKDHMMIHQSRLAAMGEMIGSIAHQWRQPLNSIGLIVQEIEDSFQYGEMNDEKMKENVAKVLDLLEYMSRTIDDFRNFFSKDKSMEKFSLISAVKKCISFIEPSFIRGSIEVELIFDKDINVQGYPNEFAQVLLNILNNSKDSILESKVDNPLIKIEIEEKNSYAVINVYDNGVGIPLRNKDRIFEPYFTTKSKGMGLGLYISKLIIEKNMRGRIYNTESLMGACIKIEIPVKEYEK